ncbi:MAG: (d)CMP kinase [Pseudomonadota bacterium]
MSAASDPPLFVGVIALDGPAASGKGTIAKRLAARYGLPHLDTGLLYRGVGAAMRARGAALENAAEAARCAACLDTSTLDDPALRSVSAGQDASIVAAYPEVRAALLKVQRDFAARPGGAVIDGRDIGMVVCPTAKRKIFVTADVDVRAKRRALELSARGETADLAQIQAALEERDRRDRERSVSPLLAPPDAHLLDTTNLDIERSVARAIAFVER